MTRMYSSQFGGNEYMQPCGPGCTIPERLPYLPEMGETPEAEQLVVEGIIHMLRIQGFTIRDLENAYRGITQNPDLLELLDIFAEDGGREMMEYYGFVQGPGNQRGRPRPRESDHRGGSPGVRSNGFGGRSGAGCQRAGGISGGRVFAGRSGYHGGHGRHSGHERHLRGECESEEFDDENRSDGSGDAWS